MRKLLAFVHVLSFVVSVGIYEGVISLEEFSDSYRVEQFSPYITQENCPADLRGVPYCLLKGSNPSTLVLGDSSILAIADAARDDAGMIFLGAGSCPMLKGLIASFSQPSCKFANEVVLKYLSSPNQIKHAYLVHRSEYLLEYTTDEYNTLLGGLIDFFNKSNITVTVVFEPMKLSSVPSQCLKRLGYFSKACNVEHTPFYMRRYTALKAKFPQVEVVESISMKDSPILFSTYKDAVHITGRFVGCYYPGLASYLSFSCD